MEKIGAVIVSSNVLYYILVVEMVQLCRECVLDVWTLFIY